MVFAWGDTLNFSHQAYKDRLTIVNWVAGMWGIKTCNPAVIKAVLSTSFKDFNLGNRHGSFSPLIGNSIFNLDGTAWKHWRALLRPQFTRNQTAHLESIKFHADMLIDRLLSESKTGTPDAQRLFFSLTFDTSTEFLCGESAGTLEGFFKSTTGNNYKYVDSRAFRRNIDICHQYVEPYILNALDKEYAGKPTLVQELMKETQDLNELRDQAFGILMAGRDTTAGTMSFLACYLSKNADIWARLKQEVIVQFGYDSSTISIEALKRCKYLSNVINERLRLDPNIPLNSRYATRDTVIPTGGGPGEDEPIFIPKGGVVHYSVYSMHRHEKLWGPDAEIFNPDRWDNYSGRWDFLPFNGGPRVCLGQQLALIEIACVFVRICQRVDLIETFINGDPAHLKQRLSASTSIDGGVPSKWT